MNTLKTVVVIAVLAIVGYGLYIGLNNGFQFQASDIPDWLELGAAPDEPETKVGTETPDLTDGQTLVADGTKKIDFGSSNPAKARYPDSNLKLASTPPIAVAKTPPTTPTSSDKIPDALSGRSTANLREPILKKTDGPAMVPAKPVMPEYDSELVKSDVVPPANPTNNVLDNRSIYSASPSTPESGHAVQATMDTVQRQLNLEQYSDALLT
ncbi:MAG: hypothetical protein N2C12_11135, partial [Planctomycetales bacterium]